MTVKLEAQIEVDSVLAEPALLEEIDRLFACNVGEYINLPQLVVVGDQSSGKSSVLEGLTKLKSPRNTGDNLPTFSSDVFRLEIIGPHEDHLSVIDVPYIFKTTTPGLTSKSDIALVRDMVLNYMRNPRSMMLAVVPANVDIATQEIIEIARELDPDGIRTLRILTKPDLVDEGAEEKIIDLVEGTQDSEELG
ncbi:hypothetical protein AnigIFM63604_004249 [Aspergillus niger]|uniref:Dynamin GTPase domain-containing protein n=1 Tax=Aspergillus niger TaxID=5061 RepID=A0A9W6AG83_ASPNG|nr:hypothetical protein AnigIFM63604_004249 [Aspergillus niger]